MTTKLSFSLMLMLVSMPSQPDLPFFQTHHLAWILMVFVVVTLCFFIGRAIYLMPRTGDIEPVPDVGSNFGIVIDAGSVHRFVILSHLYTSSIP